MMSTEDEVAFERYQFYKKRLQAILKKKNPKKIKAVDGLLSKYRGREHGVYAKVCAKYGITPKAEWKPIAAVSIKQRKKDKIKTNIKQNLSKIKKQKIANQASSSSSSKPKSINNKLLALKNKKINKKSIGKIKQNIIKKPQQIKRAIVVPKDTDSEDEYEDDFEVFILYFVLVLFDALFVLSQDYSDDFEEEKDEKTQRSARSIVKKPKTIKKAKTNRLAIKYVLFYFIQVAY